MKSIGDIGVFERREESFKEEEAIGFRSGLFDFLKAINDVVEDFGEFMVVFIFEEFEIAEGEII